MDDDQFERLFRVLQPQLMRHAEAQLDWAAAQDVVSATLMTMWMKAAELRIAGDGIEREIRALAFTVLAGEIRNEYRARKRRADLTRRTALMDPRPELAPDSHGDVIGRWSVTHWLGHLARADQEVILLINADFAIDEIAGMLNCSVAAVAKRRTRARRRLKEVLENVRAAT